MIVTGTLLVSSSVFAADKVKVGYLSTMTNPIRMRYLGV